MYLAEYTSFASFIKALNTLRVMYNFIDVWINNNNNVLLLYNAISLLINALFIIITQTGETETHI